MFELDYIWRALTQEQIGFYTFDRRTFIEEVPGIYAWFLPLRVVNDFNQALTRARNVFSYDTKSDGFPVANSSFPFGWDEFKLQISKNLDVTPGKTYTDALKAVEKMDPGAKQRLKSVLLAGSIFARPLYVGLTKSLRDRHAQHTLTNNPSDFQQRFNAFMKYLYDNHGLQSALTTQDLLFVCIPLGVSKEDFSESHKEELELIEEVLKTLCQPIYSAR